MDKKSAVEALDLVLNLAWSNQKLKSVLFTIFQLDVYVFSIKTVQVKRQPCEVGRGGHYISTLRYLSIMFVIQKNSEKWYYMLQK